MFHVGQEVVCIKKGKWSNEYIPNSTKGRYPRYGEKFVIEDIIYNYEGKELLSLVGVNVIILFGPHTGKRTRYCSTQFRPIVKQSKGMEMLNSILNNPHQRIKGKEENKFNKELVDAKRGNFEEIHH